MGFPSKKEIEEVLKKLEKAEGSLSIPKNATPLEMLRFDICKRLIIYLHDNNLQQNELADFLGVDKSDMSKILRYRIDSFSTDKLIEIYSKINPKLELKIS